MSAPVYIGDEVSSAGYRLAGARTVVCLPGRETAALAESCGGAPLVLVSAAVAARIDAALLRRALSSLAPLVLVVPDPQGEAALPDLAARLRTQLGLEA